MRHEDKVAYLKAMVDYAEAKASGCAWPLVVDAYAFFSAATRKAKLTHGFDPKDRLRIVRRFGDAFINQLASGGKVNAYKVCSDMVKFVEHGKQAKIDANRTAEGYRENSGLERGATGFALFANGCSKSHPMLQTDLKRRRKRIVTEGTNHNRRVFDARSKGLLEDDDLVELTIDGHGLALPSPKSNDGEHATAETNDMPTA